MQKSKCSSVTTQTLFRYVAIVVAIAMTVIVPGCRGDDQASGSSSSQSRTTREKIVLTGSSTLAPLMEKIGRRFESLHPHVRVDVQTGGSSRGISDTLNGVATLGMASRELTSTESDGLVTHSIGMDGICMVVHRTNKLTNLSTEQIRSIYRGQVDDWKALGGEAGQLIVINKAEGRGTLDVFLSRMSLKVTEIKADLIAGDNQQVIKSIDSNPLAIGYVSLGAADYAVQTGGNLKIVSLDGIAPTIENIRDGHFKMARPLLLISKGEAAEMPSRLIAFAQSNEVSDLLKEQYFVPSKQ